MIKPTSSFCPRVITSSSLLPGTLLTSLEETPLHKQWGEGKENQVLARGVDDFLNAGLGLVLRKFLLGGLPGGMCTWDLLLLSASSCPGKKTSGCRTGPSDCESMWKLDIVIVGGSVLSFRIALLGNCRVSKPQLCTKGQTTGKRNRNKQRK